MAAYVTEQNLIDAFGAEAVLTVADRDGDGVNDSAAIAKAISDASELCDGYLAARYPLPLVTVPAALVLQCGAIAFYFLASHGAIVPDEVRTRYEDAIKWLTQISSGAVSLGLPDPPASAQGSPEFSGPDRAFTRGKMGNL